MKKDLQYLKIIGLLLVVALSCVVVTFIHEIATTKHDPTLINDFYLSQQWMSSLEHHNISVLHERKIVSKTYYPIISQGYKINNEGICRGVEKVSCLVIVHTAANHFLRRVRMRTTWLNSTHYSPESVRVVFLLGLVPDAITQHKIEQENKLYKDIVQGYFLDSYRNLTHKGVMGYKWISEHCMNAEIVAKIDDDAFINFFKFFEDMSHLKHKKKTMYCNKIPKDSMKIIRQNTSKWFVKDDEFKDMKRYPHTYCSGFTVFISTDLVPMLYRAAIASPFFWVDDFFLFGLLPSKVPGMVHEAIRPNLTFMHPEAYTCYIRNGKNCGYLVFPAKDKEIARMWLAITHDRKQSIYGNYYMDLSSKS